MIRRTDTEVETPPDAPTVVEANTRVESEYRERDRTVDVAVVPWSPLQVVGLIVGIGFGALGIAAVARTGFETSHIYTPHAVVWTLPHSPLLGVIEIGFGLMMVLGSVVPAGSRGFLGLLGAISVAFGIVVVTETVPNRLNDWLAVAHRNGWLFVITGAVLLLASFAAPVFGGVRHQSRIVRRDETSL